MMDMQAMINAMSEVGRRTRQDYHLTLGRLIEALREIAPTTPVVVGSPTGVGLGSPHSYRGYYSDLAFEFAPLSTAASLLADCERILNTTLEGYKGGDFLMDERTPLWISSYGDASGLAIIGLQMVDGVVVIQTQDVDR